MVQAGSEDPTLEVILNLKRKLAEPEDASDSDTSSIGDANNNRGKKLKRHARYVHRGRLAGAYGLTLDGAVVEYGGKLRNIIDFNPKRRRKNLHDEDNEEDEEEEDPEREPLEDDSWAYGQVNVKDLLIPLSHPSELVTHPALVRIFKNNKIHVLAEQALESIRAEHEHMTKLSRLLSVLLGDEPINEESELPPEQIPLIDDTESDKDVDIMDLDEPAKDKEIPNGEQPNGHAPEPAQPEPNGVETNGEAEQPPQPEQSSEETLPSADPMETDEPAATTADEQPPPTNNAEESNPPNGTAGSPTATPSRSLTPQTRPTTRLQTAATRPTPSTSDNEFQWPPEFIQHIPVTTAADLGLTPNEASEVRRMVQAALERSQEFLRCLYKVRAALVRADKQRKQVWSWCKDSAKLVAEQEKEEQ